MTRKKRIVFSIPFTLVCHECSIEDQFYSSPDFKQLKCRNNQPEISILSIIPDVSGKWQTGRNVVMNMPPPPPHAQCTKAIMMQLMINIIWLTWLIQPN